MRHAAPGTERRVSRFCAKMKFVVADGADRPAALETGQLHHGRRRAKPAFERRRCATGSQRVLREIGNTEQRSPSGPLAPGICSPGVRIAQESVTVITSGHRSNSEITPKAD